MTRAHVQLYPSTAEVAGTGTPAGGSPPSTLVADVSVTVNGPTFGWTARA